jgi:hypothetical protein
VQISNNEKLIYLRQDLNTFCLFAFVGIPIKKIRRGCVFSPAAEKLQLSLLVDILSFQQRPHHLYAITQQHKYGRHCCETMITFLDERALYHKFIS